MKDALKFLYLAVVIVKFIITFKIEILDHIDTLLEKIEKGLENIIKPEVDRR